MRTTISLEDDVYQAAKTLAESSGQSLGSVVSGLIRRGLQPRPVVEEDGLPMFDVPSDAAIIPGDRASELLADDGTD